MNAKQFSRNRDKRRQAIALVMVITVVALMSILMVAIFSVTRTEYKSTQIYVAAKSAKQLGDIGTAIVQAQIECAQNPDAKNSTVSSSMYTHATQPGMVRTYDSSGGFYAAYKLYSSSTMKVQGSESSLYTDQHIPPSTWNTQTGRYVDLNEPVIRAGLTAGTYAVYFPILDPRAAWNYGAGGQGGNPTYGSTQVEGFSYTKTAPAASTGGNQDYSSVVVTPTDTDKPENLRLPMPVEWMYVLEDGTVGTLDSSNKFVSAGQGVASADNPIVGRVAFWTDDESCKININTASEPTYMSTPFFFHERDVKWAHFPAVTGEYQRYPGHPATVALSAVLAPYYTLDPMMPSWDGFGSYTDIVTLKETIYDIAPKIGSGGSKEGTLPFAVDQLTTDQTFGNTNQASTAIDLTNSAKERLYASVDEMLFKDLTFDGGGIGRSKAVMNLPNSNTNMLDHDTLERSRFFLTAQSRSPEFSIHGLPRVCIWPVADESRGDKWRTTFDNMTAFCSTLVKGSSNGKYSYSFRRAYPRDYLARQAGTNPDVDISRNKDLLNYLVNQMTSLSWPQTSYQPNSTGSLNFNAKYGSDNVNQLAVQFFDYIRCTNLYDGIESRNNNATSAPNSSNPAGQSQYADDNYKSSCYTFTSQRLSQPPSSLTVSGDAAGNTAAASTGSLPGHGQVGPAIWNTNGKQYKGLGRMFTISEIGFQFICTGDGNAATLADTHSLTGINTPNLVNTFPNCMVGALHPVTNNGPYVGTGGRAAIAFQTGSNTGTAQSLIDNPANVYGGQTVQTGNQNGLNVPVGGPYYWSNFPPLSADPHPLKTLVDFYLKLYGCAASNKGGGGRTGGTGGSNPLLHPSRHPGFYPKFWNMTLAQDTPLKPTEKRIQVVLMLEFFCPSVGWTSFNPEWTVELDQNIGNMTLSGQRLFDTAAGLDLKSNGNVYDSSAGAHAVGGHVGPSAIAGNRLTRTISGSGQGGNGNVLTASDSQYNSSGGVTSTYATGNTAGHNGLQNFAFCSNYITVDTAASQSLQVGYPGKITIKIFDTHNYDTAQPVQLIDVDLSQLPTSIPIPNLAGGNPYTQGIDQYGRITYTRSRQGPHYWAANYSGAINRMQGTPNGAFNTDTTTGTGAAQTYSLALWTAGDEPKPLPPSNSDHNQALHGRLDTSATLYSDTQAGGRQTYGTLFPQGLSLIADGFTDVVCSLVPAAGDYRTLAAQYHVQSDWWQKHPMTNLLGPNLHSAHSFSSYRASTEPGCILATDSPTGNNYNMTNYQLVADAQMFLPSVSNGQLRTSMNPQQPDLPPGLQDYVYPANAFGDFDTGIAGAREGPYINKPDEGNYYVGQESTAGNQTYRSAYFYNDWNNADDWRSGIYMTPNRMISSPVMFGSLPTGVWGAGNTQINAAQGSIWAGLSSTSAIAPWQTLLFRPHAYNSQSQVPSQQYHPGMENPCDHYLLDMFFMPVVEPYAISEPLSIAGRINMNYQIMPFTNIRRATGMHALMKGEFMTAVPNSQIVYAKEYKLDGSNSAAWKQNFYNDKNDGYYWHRPIDPVATLRQFDLKFSHKSGGSAKYQGLFRSASQICEMHLIPKTVNGGTNISNVQGIANANSQDDINSSMNTFWAANRPTGDNVRERPYSNLYARLTTRTNTFRVHVRAQVLKKTRSSDPTIFDVVKDANAVVSEYRGSTLLERYIDPNDTTQNIPDYAQSGLSQTPLDSFYRFHVLETKRFNP